MRTSVALAVLVAAFAFGYFGSAGVDWLVDWLRRPHNAVFAFRLALVAAGAAILLAAGDADSSSLHARQCRGACCGATSHTLGGTPA